MWMLDCARTHVKQITMIFKNKNKKLETTSSPNYWA